MADVFWRQLFAPFVTVPILLIAYYIARWITPWIPEGRIKRYLTKPRSNRSEFFERIDARIFAFLRSVARKARGQ